MFRERPTSGVVNSLFLCLMIVVVSSLAMRLVNTLVTTPSILEWNESLQSPRDRLFFDIPVAFADTNAWQAEVVSQSVRDLKLDSGKGYTVDVTFRNTGTATWKKSSKNFVALNVTNPTGRNSAFRHAFWKKSYRPNVVSQETVKPGETTIVRFALQAPVEHGFYSEDFQLVSENLTWIPGSLVHVDITVGNPKPHWQAELVSVTPSTITMTPGSAVTVEAIFKNTGAVSWQNTGKNFVALNVTNPAGRASLFRHGFWQKDYRPATLKESTVAPNENGSFRFALQAPTTTGTSVENFALVAENLTWITGGETSLNIMVEPKVLALNEPLIRVGLYNPSSNRLTVTATTGYTVRNGNNTILQTLTAQDAVAVVFENNLYTATSSLASVTAIDALRVVGETADTVFTITDYENRPEWNTDLNDNQFRSTLEMQYAESTDKLWVVNELPLEYYVRGIAEASDDEHAEYLKTLLTAARTYALYHYEHPTKHAGEPYLLDATAGDQVYRGYGFEKRAPNVTAAVVATEGQVVTYDNEVVVTPYFSHSDGRTRAWEEVWGGGPYPWLVSVTDSCCTELELLGHGVGLSALGARQMAQSGSLFHEILAYYYTGIEIVKVY